MNVSILTQPLHTNYGGTLQAFALQYILREIGCDPLTINYRRNVVPVNVVRQQISRLKQKIFKGKIIYPFSDDELSIIGEAHNNFIEKYISYSKPVYDVSTLNSLILERHSHAVIVGSDQTWRPRYSPRIDSYFLDFLKDTDIPKKIAYAASFGTDEWEFTPEQTALFSELVKKFNNISVRESSAVQLCNEHFDITPVHVLDPTLLLGVEVYMDLIRDCEPNHVGKVFNYVLDQCVEKNKVLEKTRCFLNRDSFSTYPKCTIKNKKYIHDYSDYIYPSIESWIRSFHDASFIVTDSFHGTVFSLIFNKPFISIANETRGKARFTSLLQMFGLEHRLVSSDDEITQTLINESIDYTAVNKRANELRHFSFDFLRKSLLG